MLLTSPEYYCILGLTFFVFWLLRARPAVLGLVLAVNLFFYAKWGLIYLLLVPVAATCDFFLGRGIERWKQPSSGRLLISVSVLINIGLIFFCRYMPHAGLLLPLSLSFYAFQALTYTLDIYRGDAKPIPSYFTYISSVTFFASSLFGVGRANYSGLN